MGKTRSPRAKGNGSATVVVMKQKIAAQMYIMFGVFVSVVVFLVYWLMAWNYSITHILLVDAIDMNRLTWINVLIDPVAQGAAILYNQALFFLTIGIFSVVIFMFFLIPGLVAMKK